MKQIIYSMLPLLNVNLLLILLFLLLPSQSCKQATEPRLEPELALTLEDVSCTEAWIQLTTTNLQLPTTINVLKNNTVAQTFSLSTHDTLLYIDSLLPNQTYKFKVVLTNNLQPTSYPQPPTSNELSITTMDTTSHEFTWQSWEFGGDCGSSSLYDVAIIDENNIWAVGEIYIRDSLGNCDPNAYNAVHWDGTKWELKRIYFPTVCGSTSITSYPAKAIFVFDNGKIWISSSGDKIATLKDGIQIDKFCLPSNVSMSINKLWGSSSSDLYAVGNNGNIAHWDGRKWTKIESGTTLNINDIWGDYNQKTGEWEILAVASNIGRPLGRYLIQIKKGNTTLLSLSSNVEQLESVWFISNRHYYIAGGGIYQKKFLSDSLWRNKSLDITQYWTTSIRGSNINNVVAVGAFGDFVHYNGKNWKALRQAYLVNGAYRKVEVKGNLIVCVGGNYHKAVITIAKR